MAKTIATCWGYDTTRVKTDHRLGSVAAKAEVATYRTFATAHVNADGSGYMELIRQVSAGHRKVLFTLEFDPEDQPFVHPFTKEVSR